MTSQAPNDHSQTILLIEPESSRRKVIAQALSESSYEVIPAVDAAEGARYLPATPRAVVVVPVELLNDELLAPQLAPEASGDHTVIALGPAEAEEEVPRRFVFLSISGLSPLTFLQQLRLILLGRRVRLEADAELETLVGELSQRPFSELLMSLGSQQLSGRVESPDGVLWLEEGNPVCAALVGPDGLPTAASEGRGVKIFCRLARRNSGPVRVRLRPSFGWPGHHAAPEVNLEDDLLMLLDKALQDLRDDMPPLRSRVRVQPAAQRAVGLGGLDEQLLEAAEQAGTVERLLDISPATDGRILDALIRLAQQGLVSFDEPRAAVAIVTDSTADLPRALARRHGIQVVPLKVHFGDRTYRDGRDLRPRQFFELLESGAHHPSSEPPDPADFATVYDSLPEGQEALSIHISAKLSQTSAHAQQGASGYPVQTVDSGVVSLTLGMMALLAARAAARGLGAEESAQLVQRWSRDSRSLFVVDTLEYLARGGRIGKAQAWIGGVLGIKPILGVQNGEIVPVDKVRGGRKAQPRIADLFSQQLPSDHPMIAGVVHAKAPVWADRLRQLLSERFSIQEVVVSEMGPVVGTHAGPGAVGACLVPVSEQDLPLIAPL